MHQDDEYGKSVLDGFTQQLEVMKLTPASITSYKRGASDFSAQIAKMKADGCDLVVLGTVDPRDHRCDERSKKTRLGRDLSRCHPDQRA